MLEYCSSICSSNRNGNTGIKALRPVHHEHPQVKNILMREMIKAQHPFLLFQNINMAIHYLLLSNFIPSVIKHHHPKILRPVEIRFL